MADPKLAFQLTLLHEGGFQDDPQDRGNWTGGEIGKGVCVGTKYGISAAQFPGLPIRDLTPEQAIAEYCEGYWKDGYSQIVGQSLASKLADMGVLFGVKEAVKILQIVLKIIPSGDFDLTTLDAVNQSDPVQLLTEYKLALITHVHDIGVKVPSEQKYVKGWVNRINS